MTQRSDPMKDVTIDPIVTSMTQTFDQISTAMGSSRCLTITDVLDESQLATFKARYRAHLDESIVLTEVVKDQWVKALRSVALTGMANLVEATPLQAAIKFSATWLTDDGVLEPLSWLTNKEDAS